MTVVSFPARNKLAYPATRLPGFDPSHPAAQNCGFSGVATYGGTFGHVLSRVKGTEGGTKTTSINGSLGPVTNYLNDGVTTQDSTVFPFVTSAAALTLAAIFKITAALPTTGYLLNTASAGANGIGDAGGTGNFWIVGNVNTDTGVTYALGVPYFFAASWTSSGSGTLNWVIARLDTGEIKRGTAVDSNSAGDGTITVGSRGTAARQINGGIAAAMVSNSFMSERQLRAWAADPWAFWYPPQQRSRVAAAAAATFLAGWAQQTNLPVLGTGTY